MSNGKRIGYISIWTKQDLDTNSKVVGTGKVKTMTDAKFNATVFRSESGQSSISISHKKADGTWSKDGTLHIEMKPKDKMIALAKGLFLGEPVVLFLFDNSEKQELNLFAPDYTGTIYEDLPDVSEFDYKPAKKPVGKPVKSFPDDYYPEF